MSLSSRQLDRHMGLATPLGEDVLVLRSLTLDDQLGLPFDLRLEMLSEREDISHGDLLGQNVTARLDGAGGRMRFFNGYVSEFSYLGQSRAYVSYSARVRPWLWFLGKTSDCRIFQHQSVPQIVEKVFREQGFTDFELRLNESYRTWDYCVQYRESDLNFVSRLMEQEGIYFYFEHENGKHTLVLADGYASHTPSPGYERLSYYPPSSNLVREDHFSSWSIARQVESGTAEVTDYDFKKPRADLRVRKIIEQAHANASFSRFDYPGEYAELGEGEDIARRHMEGIAANHERGAGSGNVRGLSAGSLFNLALHPRLDQNREYLVVNSRLHAVNNEIETQGSTSASINGKVGVVDAKVPYRSPRRARKVTVEGPQTAVVTGPPGEEIWTDEYGRVKVQFHWDRYAQGNADTSCWVRVSQPQAGKGWGAISLPRIGQEVIVNFLEGDADRPIITGRVYNGDNMPPYALPANATISTFKSSSSKGGQGFNELRFEDRQGAEQVFMHAERDHDLHVKHDQREFVGNMANRVVTNDTFEHLQNDFHQTIDGDRMSQVKGTASLTIDGESHMTVGSSHGLRAGTEVHIKAGSQIVLEAGSSVTLKSGGSFINVTPGGIFGSAPSVNLNSGGSASSGAGAAPSAPGAAAMADDDSAGEVAAVTERESEPDQFTAQAVSVMLRAAVTGSAFAQICNQK